MPVADAGDEEVQEMVRGLFAGGKHHRRHGDALDDQQLTLQVHSAGQVFSGVHSHTISFMIKDIIMNYPQGTK